MNRYQARWSNGYWVLFDAIDYENLDAFGSREEAEQAVSEASAAGKWRAGRCAAQEFPWRLSENPQRIPGFVRQSAFRNTPRLLVAGK